MSDMNEWLLIDGEPASNVRQPDYERGIAIVRNPERCSQCDGMGGTRRRIDGPSETCPRCNGTGMRAVTKRAYLRTTLRAVRARQVRIRLHHQNRMARERMARAERFEEDHAETLALLREYRGESARMREWLAEAERTRMLSDERVRAIHEAARDMQAQVEARRSLEAEANESEFIGCEGDRVIIDGTVRVARRFGTRVEVIIVGGSGNWFLYSGTAQALRGLVRGQRICLQAESVRPCRLNAVAPDGSRPGRVYVEGTRIKRPTQVRT